MIFKGLNLALCIHKLCAASDDFLRSAFDKGHLLVVGFNYNAGILFCRVKCVELCNTALIQVLCHFLIYQICHKCTIGGVTADNSAIMCSACTIVNANTGCDGIRINMRYAGQRGEVLKITSRNLNDRELAARNSACLIAKKDVKAASCLKAIDLTYENVVLCHLERLE